ncbi:MAG: methyltransferase domain-containing protein [Planctomycetia bacterium]|nr:methyltransferase domain-containing protein [Planctomycetia bacterium]
MPWSFSRSRAAELMDDPRLGEAEHLHALSALGRINAVSRTAARLADEVRRMLPNGCGAGRQLMVVDVASGGGDVTIGVARRLRGAGGPHGQVDVVGIDVSARAVERSRRAAAGRGVEAAFAVCDVLGRGCPPCDVAVSSLFLHHLDDADAVGLLRAMAEAARIGLVVSDLVRSRLGLGLAVVGTALLSTSRVARVDGPLSVRAARTPAEYRRLCVAAGLPSATIRRVWPERVLIRWRRPGTEAAR